MSRGVRLAVCAAVAVSMLAATEASAAKLSIELERETLAYGKRLDIRGFLKTDDGISAKGHQVLLYESRFPYKESKVVARGTTKGTGEYRFRERPAYNSKYRVAISDETVAVRSRRAAVYISPRLSASARVNRKGTVKASFTVRYSPALPANLSGSRVAFYIRDADGNDPFIRKDTTRARERRPGLLVGRGSYQLPSNGEKFRTLGCIDFPNKDFGLFGPGFRDIGCPRRISSNSGRVAPRQAAAFSNLSASPFIP